VRRAEGAIFEARKPYLKQQMELCINASESAAVLASTHDYAMWEKARERFWVLYWRPLSIVEMPFGDDIGPVEQLMVAIGNKLGPVKDNPELPLGEMELLSFQLAHHCRDLILRSCRIGPYEQVF
jgi:hypothetical protein